MYKPGISWEKRKICSPSKYRNQVDVLLVVYSVYHNVSPLFLLYRDRSLAITFILHDPNLDMVTGWRQGVGSGADGCLIKLDLYKFALSLIRHEKLGLNFGCG